MTEVNFNRSIEIKRVKRVSKDVASTNFKKSDFKRKPKRDNKSNNHPHVKTEEQVKEQLKNAINKVGGRYVRFDDDNHTEGLLIAAVNVKSEIENIPYTESYNFAILNKDRRVSYLNNNEHFSILSDVPVSLFVLDYLYKREPKTLLDIATTTFNTDNVDIITDIRIYIPKERKQVKKGNKNFKNNKNSGKKHFNKKNKNTKQVIEDKK